MEAQELQSRIDAAVADAPSSGKLAALSSLRSLFAGAGVRVFTDFDDTLTAPGSAFNTRARLARWLAGEGARETGSGSVSVGASFKGEIRANPLFPGALRRAGWSPEEPVVVISRSRHDDLAGVVPDVMAQAGVKSFAWVGVAPGLEYSSAEKLLALPESPASGKPVLFFGDDFESPELRSFGGFRFVRALSPLGRAELRAQKIFRILADLFGRQHHVAGKNP